VVVVATTTTTATTKSRTDTTTPATIGTATTTTTATTKSSTPAHDRQHTPTHSRHHKSDQDTTTTPTSYEHNHGQPTTPRHTPDMMSSSTTTRTDTPTTKSNTPTTRHTLYIYKRESGKINTRNVKSCIQIQLYAVCFLNICYLLQLFAQNVWWLLFFIITLHQKTRNNRSTEGAGQQTTRSRGTNPGHGVRPSGISCNSAAGSLSPAPCQMWFACCNVGTAQRRDGCNPDTIQSTTTTNY